MQFAPMVKKVFLWLLAMKLTLLVNFTRCSFWVALSNVNLYKLIANVDNQWIHLVLNFKGVGKGFQVFIDGTLVSSQPTIESSHRAPGDGRLVLGRRYPNSDNFYSSIDLDEVVFFNRKLTEPEVGTMHKNYWTVLGSEILISYSSHNKCSRWTSNLKVKNAKLKKLLVRLWIYSIFIFCNN